MMKQGSCFLGVLLVLIHVSYSAVFRGWPLPKSVFEDGSGELPYGPDSLESDKNLPEMPPVDPALGDEFYIDIFDRGVNDPRDRPGDVEGKNSVDRDSIGGRDNSNPEIISESSPDVVKDDYTFEEHDWEEKNKDIPVESVDVDDDEENKESKEDEDNEIHEGKNIDENIDKEFDAEDTDESVDEEIPGQKDYIDDPRDSEEVPDEDIEDSEEAGTFHGGFSLDTPFFDIDQVTKYFYILEKALEHVFLQSVEEAISMNGTYTNTTEEEVDIGGKKYIVQKSIIKGKNNSSSIYVETLSSWPKGNKTKAIKDFKKHD